MKFLLSLILVVSFAVPAFAAYSGPGSNGKAPAGGFKGPESGAMATTVEKALQLPDNARLILTGNIISKIAGSKDEYMFKDATGEIQVEISDKYFRGLPEVTPETTVRISGKMDKDFAKNPEIDVKNLEIVK